MNLKQMIKDGTSKKELKFPLDIQFFAEGDTPPVEPPAEPEQIPTTAPVKEVKEVKTLTSEQVNEIVQARLAKEKLKWDEEKLKEQNEADKLKKMNDVQKAEYKTQQKEEELAKKEAELNRRELMAQAKVTLIEKGIPADMAEFLNFDSAEKCNESIDKLANSFNLSIEKSIDDKLKGGSAIKKFQQPTGALTRAEIEAMSPEEINANWDKVSEAMKTIK